MQLENKTVLLTGASGGIGRETVRVLGAAGANVIAHWSRNQDAVAEAARHIPPERLLLVQADFTEPHGADDLWRQAIAWRGTVDVLVNNAGVMLEAGFDDKVELWDRAWETTFLVNVVHPIKLMRLAVNHFRSRGGGVLITMSSWSAQRGSGNPNLTAYAAAKAAVAAATKTIARTFARDNVLAYCVSPGPVDTDMTHRSALNQGGLESVLAGLAMGELVPPKEIAELVAFLATGASRHLTGATLDVNGATYIR